jgi:hypothetical protein
MSRPFRAREPLIIPEKLNQSKGLLQTMVRCQMLEPIRFFGPDRAGWFLRAMVRVTFFGACRGV